VGLTARRVQRSARGVASSAIGIYQRWVSPHKGFACACRVHEGRASCSAFARRAIGIHGLGRGTQVARARLRRCGEVHRRSHGLLGGAPARRALGQRGDCDPGCADLPCDLPGGSGSGRRGSCPNVLDCADCGCDGCGQDRNERDVLADWGPTILWVLTVLLSVWLGSSVVGCGAGGCLGLWSMQAWWGFFGLTCMFGVVVLVLRLRREMAPFTTLATVPVLTALAVVAAGGAASLFGLG
jgi:uncharacterized protein